MKKEVGKEVDVSKSTARGADFIPARPQMPGTLSSRKAMQQWQARRDITRAEGPRSTDDSLCEPHAYCTQSARRIDCTKSFSQLEQSVMEATDSTPCLSCYRVSQGKNQRARRGMNCLDVLSKTGGRWLPLRPTFGDNGCSRGSGHGVSAG